MDKVKLLILRGIQQVLWAGEAFFAWLEYPLQEVVFQLEKKISRKEEDGGGWRSVLEDW